VGNHYSLAIYQNAVWKDVGRIAGDHSTYGTRVSLGFDESGIPKFELLDNFFYL
jgi:hypothetical protein